MDKVNHLDLTVDEVAQWCNTTKNCEQTAEIHIERDHVRNFLLPLASNFPQECIHPVWENVQCKAALIFGKH